MEYKCKRCNEYKDSTNYPPSSIKINWLWCRTCNTEYYRIKNNVQSPRIEDVDNKRRCSKCKNVKELSLFTKDKKCNNGYSRKCKECTYKSPSRINNKKYIKEYKKSWYSKNREKILKRRKEYYKKNHVQIKKYQFEYNKINKDKVAKRIKEWHKNNPHVGIASSHKRRILSKSNGINDLTSSQIKEIRKKPCFACGNTKDITIDHIIPLIRGGQNTYSNCMPLCRSCNSSKQSKTFNEWLDFKRKIS